MYIYLQNLGEFIFASQHEKNFAWINFRDPTIRNVFAKRAKTRENAKIYPMKVFD